MGITQIHPVLPLQWHHFTSSQTTPPTSPTLSPSTPPSTTPPSPPLHNHPPTNTPHQPNLRHNRLILALTGATGSIYGIRTLQTLHNLNITTHLILSKWALSTLTYETPYTPTDLTTLATHTHSPRDLSAPPPPPPPPPSSGSFPHDGMIIAPCMMKTLAAIRMGYGEDLIARAGDVCIKEGRKFGAYGAGDAVECLAFGEYVTPGEVGGCG
ncbi:Phenylacrylic acid decarboxylase, partial [Aspergillus ibericus CBS 121593]